MLLSINKTFLLYGVILVVFGLGMFFAIDRGQHLQPRSVEAPAKASPRAISPSETDSSWLGLDENIKEPLSRLFIQLSVVLVATRVVGSLFVKMGQPAVVGEMFAGVLLGPSLFGLLFPGCFNFIFPVASPGTLKLL